jgi:tetratricopeptide (TPR) repeat protein
LLFLRACALYALCEWNDAEEEARACLAAEWSVNSEINDFSVERRGEVEEQVVRGQAAAQQLLGLALARRGELWPSVAALSASLELEPSSADALLQRASVLLLSGRPAAAEEDCTEALELRPGWMLAHQRRGYAYAALRWFEDAASEFELAAADRPDLAVNYHAVGALTPLSLDWIDAEWTAGGGLLSFWDYGVAQTQRAEELARQLGSEETECED